MNVSGKEIRHVNIEIADDEIKRIIRDRIHTLYNWDFGYFIEDGNVVEEIEHHTSHTFYSDEFVRKATETDYEVFELIISLKKMNVI